MLSCYQGNLPHALPVRTPEPPQHRIFYPSRHGFWSLMGLYMQRQGPQAAGRAERPVRVMAHVPAPCYMVGQCDKGLRVF